MAESRPNEDAKPARPRALPPIRPYKKVLLGGLGALTPIVLNFLIVDLDVVWQRATPMAVLSYCLRVVTLFYLGGIIAWLHRTERDALRLFELGIAAPALVTGLLNGVAAKPIKSVHLFELPAAYAQDIRPKGTDGAQPSPFSIQLAQPRESLIEQFMRGFLGVSPYRDGLTSRFAIFAASQVGSSAFTAGPGSLSFFTDALLMGLSGKADTNLDGSITVGELGQFVQSTVPVSAATYGIKQFPLVQMTADMNALALVQSSNAGAKAKIRLVAAGIDRYQSSSIPRLPGAAEGAQGISELLRRRNNMIGSTVLLNEQATCSGIRSALRNALTYKDDDLMIFYFSGQTRIIRDGFASLLCSDFDGSSEQAISLGELSSFSQLKRSPVMVLLDACLPK